MRRRTFIVMLGSASALTPLVARSQDQLSRRIGVLMNQTADNPIAQARYQAFRQELRRLGWTEQNLKVEIRWGPPDAARFSMDATELAALNPDAILAASGATMPAILRATKAVPVVFVLVPDPVGSGFVASLAKPGGNVTGFSQFEFGLSGKWVELLRELDPRIQRAAVLYDPVDPAGAGQLQAVRSAATSVGIEVVPIDVREAVSIERGLESVAAASDAGLIVTGSAPAAAHRDLIVALAARHQLPAIYPYGFYATHGGLAAYGADLIDQYRQAAGYIDRILKGQKPADLPVQAPTKYELVINLRTARALGLTIPPALLARADEVIE